MSNLYEKYNTNKNFNKSKNVFKLYSKNNKNANNNNSNNTIKKSNKIMEKKDIKENIINIDTSIKLNKEKNLINNEIDNNIINKSNNKIDNKEIKEENKNNINKKSENEIKQNNIIIIENNEDDSIQNNKNNKNDENQNNKEIISNNSEKDKKENIKNEEKGEKIEEEKKEEIKEKEIIKEREKEENKEDKVKNKDNEQKEENEENEQKDEEYDNGPIYDLLLIVKSQDNEEIFQKNILIDKSSDYQLDLDKIFQIIISTLRQKNISYKYGLSYKISYLDLEEKVGLINILEYDILSEVEEKDGKYIKKLNMEINIINGKNISEDELLGNPQLYCKLTKNYTIIPTIKVINCYNLFKYNKGLKIIFKYITILFNKDEIYDLTFVNFDEFMYNEDTEIFFDTKNYLVENSTMKKIENNNITLIYRGIGTKYEDNLNNKNILMDYLNKRYKCENYRYDSFNNQIILFTKLGNLLISEEESNLLYEEFKRNILK